MRTLKAPVTVAIAATVSLAACGSALAQGSAGDNAGAIAFLSAITALITVPLGGWFAYSGHKGLRQARTSRAWPTVQATILESRVDQTLRLTGLLPSSDDSIKTEEEKYTFTPVIRYSYEVGGTRHESGAIQHGLTHLMRKKAEQMTAQYAVGSSYPVHYDPAAPATAILDPSGAQAKVRLWIGFALIASPFAVALIAWLATRP